MSELSSPGPSNPPSFLARLIGTGCFVGYVPWASGTFGALVGCAILLIPGVWTPGLLLPLIGVTFSAGVWSSAVIARHEGHRLTGIAARTKERFQPGKHGAPDPSIVVIDEIVGMWISAASLPPSLPLLGLCFILFRLFDIVKPPPAAWVERVPHGWGIMLDDVIAGLYANLATRLILVILSSLHIL
ncbi:MAG: phosphatidylglycerophosphatase A [Bacteroidota bacterium]